MPKCIVCEKDFEAKRSDAKLCSPVCRQKAARKGIRLRGGVTGEVNIMPEKTEKKEPEEQPTETPKEEKKVHKSKEMPAGLTKSETLRWHREHPSH